MTPVIYSLPYDPTGTNPRNRVVRERHSLESQTGLPYRVTTLDHGHFYTNNLEVTDEKGYVLHEGDFQCVALNAEATLATGQEVAAVLVITNPTVGENLFVNASMVGGTYCTLTDAIAQMTLGLLNPTRFPTWRNVTGKPDKFDVGGHLHAMWELYGFEGMCDALDHIVQLKLQAARRAYELIYTEAQANVTALQAHWDALQSDLTTHIATRNAHGTTSTHIALEKVANVPPITTAQSLTLGFNESNNYLTVQGYKNMVNTNFIPDLERHINDTNNPHRLTAEQLQVPTKSAIDIALNGKLTRGVSAVSTHRIDGASYASFYNTVRANLNADWITAGRIDIRRLVSNPGNTTSAVVGGNQVTNIDTLIRNYLPARIKVVYLNNASSVNILTTLANTYTNNTQTPIGSIALAMVRLNTRYGGDNGHRHTYDLKRLRAYIKTGTSSWALL